MDLTKLLERSLTESVALHVTDQSSDIVSIRRWHRTAVQGTLRNIEWPIIPNYSASTLCTVCDSV
jgi:hypothetical protein